MINDLLAQDLSRKIYLNDRHRNAPFKYPSNEVRTRKYTLFSFLPKSLYIQFLRIANIYFLGIAVLSSFPDISPLGPISSIPPLVFVLFTSILREGIEDYNRYKNDKNTNNRKTHLYRGYEFDQETFQEVRWRELHVGDIVKVHKDEEFPADMVVLLSSDESGGCYIETASLDGERNLKLRSSQFEIRQTIKNHGIRNFAGRMLADQANSKVHKFKGVLEIDGNDTTLYLNPNNLVLRGTFLKNTDYIIGLVVYAGLETKLMMNQGIFRNKKTSIEKQLNNYIIFLFIFQLLLCILFSILSVLAYEQIVNEFDEQHDLKLSYLFSAAEISEDNSLKHFFQSFGAFLMLLNTMIPISLIVSLEIGKWYQGVFLGYDEIFKHDGQTIKVLNNLVHEDLAKIDYIFADKTGTLTTNDMKFNICSIYGTVYSFSELKKKNQDDSIDMNLELVEYKEFWKALTLCHDVIIDTHHIAGSSKPKYHGSSPDEVELVGAAAEVGYKYIEKTGDILTLDIDGKKKKYRVLLKIEFSSERKRMSVVCRDLETDKLCLYTKGADNVILKRVKIDTDPNLYDKTKEDLKSFSHSGLRTLLVGYKEIEEEDFIKWNERYALAKLDEYNLLTTDEDPLAKLRALEEELEKDISLLGATGLEDKLQDGVAEAIKDFHRADFKIWMLTGDKLETAENIGYSTNLISQTTKVFKIQSNKTEEIIEKFKKIIDKIKIIKENKGSVRKKSGMTDKSFVSMTEINLEVAIDSFALIIDGDAISMILTEEVLANYFHKLIPQFRTVICCRSTPNQKADVVKFVKKHLNATTLAIGDGGNDVNMIKVADIGIGIFGKEGNSAAFAADYAFPKFCHLWRLLLVHGRWFYYRTSNFINFFFYKNLSFTLPQVWFAMYSGFSGQSIFDDVYITNYNTAFTAIAPVHYQVLDQDVNPREGRLIFRALPTLYKEMRTVELFSKKKFIYWWWLGISHSLIIFYVTKGSYSESAARGDGFLFDFWLESIGGFSAILGVVFAILVIATNYYTLFTFFSYVVCTLLIYFPAGTFILDRISSNTANEFSEMIGIPRFWLTLLCAITLCSLLIYVPKQWVSLFNPSLSDLLQRERSSRKMNIQLRKGQPSTDDTEVEPMTEFEKSMTLKRSKYYMKIL